MCFVVWDYSTNVFAVFSIDYGEKWHWELPFFYYYFMLNVSVPNHVHFDPANVRRSSFHDRYMPTKRSVMWRAICYSDSK